MVAEGVHAFVVIDVTAGVGGAFAGARVPPATVAGAVVGLIHTAEGCAGGVRASASSRGGGARVIRCRGHAGVARRGSACVVGRGVAHTGGRSGERRRGVGRRTGRR